MNWDQLIEINSEYLIYRDDAQTRDGTQTVVTIDLSECARNFYDYLQRSGELREPSASLKTEPFRGIGWRDLFASPPYIELFAEPRLRIEFRRSWRVWDPTKKFLETQAQLLNAGWTTLDMG
ncbi:MAG: hypothetical protein QMB40_00510 [Aeromonadaceae bacterium]